MKSQLRFMVAWGCGVVSWAAWPDTDMSNGVHWLSPGDVAAHGRG